MWCVLPVRYTVTEGLPQNKLGFTYCSCGVVGGSGVIHHPLQQQTTGWLYVTLRHATLHLAHPVVVLRYSVEFYSTVRTKKLFQLPPIGSVHALLPVCHHDVY